MQAIHATRAGGHVGYVGVNHDVHDPRRSSCSSPASTLHGGPAPVRRYLPELIQLIWDRKIDPGKVFDLTLPLEEAAAGYTGDGRAPRDQGAADAVTTTERTPSGRMELQEFLDHVNRGRLIEGGSEAHEFMHAAAQEALRIARRAEQRLPHAGRGAGAAVPAHRRKVAESVDGLPAVLLRVRQEPHPRRGRLHQHGLPLPGHRRHHHRRRDAHRPRQHPDDAEPRDRPGPARRHGCRRR